VWRLKMLSYFAYGSNLHPLRLIERVSSATLVGVVTLTSHRLMFHKHSIDESSKCNVIRTGDENDRVFGAIYEIDPAQKPDLDCIEGRGCGYVDHHLSLQYQGREYTCFTYVAQRSYIVDHLKPYHWYKQLVVLGARYLRFPDVYVCSVESVESMEDPDEQRKKRYHVLIEDIITHT
jgi:gamma-glutamylcyclotransferase